MSNDKAERRSAFDSLSLGTSEDNKMHISGRCIVFNMTTSINRDKMSYNEVIDPHAFDECDFSRCCLRYNHRDSLVVMARVRGGSLSFDVRDDGVYFDATLFDTTTARDVYTVIRDGGIDECSFAFVVAPDGFTYDKATNTVRITKVARLLDVSVVDLPAYEGTDVYTRSALDMDIESAIADAITEKRTAEAQRLLLLIDIERGKYNDAQN